MKTKFTKLLISIVVSHLAGIIGSVFTFNSIENWYQFLNKPSFSPPNWLFGPVWLTLYTLMGIALFLIWQKGLKNKQNKKAFELFLLHLVFNASWSIVFFGLQEPGWAFLNILILLAFILVLIFKFWKINKAASILLWPYLLWVSFATVLNYSIWMLN
jgi:tryptophan-rich sensory protein